jgi:uncharacterized protein
MRLLILLFIAVVIWVAVETLFAGWRVRRREAATARQARQRTTARTAASVPLVRCAQCGTHVPQASALPGAPGNGPSLFYCSERCRSR